MGPAPIYILQKISTSLPNIPTFFVICHFLSTESPAKKIQTPRPQALQAPRLPLQKLRHMKQLGAISDLRSGGSMDRPLDLCWVLPCRFAVTIHSGLRECSRLEKKKLFWRENDQESLGLEDLAFQEYLYTLVFAETKFLSVKLYSLSSGCGSTVRHIPQTRT